MLSKQKAYTYGKQSISWGDVWEVVKALRSDWLTQGPRVQEFEQALCDYTGAKYCVVVANGAAALHLAALASGIQQGDEVITSPITFLASANCVLYAGGSIKFADIDPKTACIDPREIQKQITAKTRGIIPVHFAGQSCDMEAIADIAKRHNLFVIEDAAHAIGSVYKNSKIGSCAYSDMTIFSFHPVKTITTGEGGAITTNSKALYEKLLVLRSHGMTKNKAIMSHDDGPWYYEMVALGFNYRMTDIQAALGISQLRRLNTFVRRRREIVTYYKDALAHDEHFSFLEEKDGCYSAFHLCPLLVDWEKVSLDKKVAFERLSTKGLTLQVHYIPVHLQPYYKNLGFQDGYFPVAERYYEKTISLPLYPSLYNEDLKYIVEVVREVIR